MKKITLKCSYPEEKRLIDLPMLFKRLGRALTSIAIISSMLVPDIARAMEENIQDNTPRQRSTSLPNLFKSPPIEKNIPVQPIKKGELKLEPKHLSFEQSQQIEATLIQGKIEDSQKSSESKKNSSDSNTTSPRKQNTVEEITLSTSSSPEKSSASSSENLINFTAQNINLLINNTENLPKTPKISLEIQENKQQKSPFETVSLQTQSSRFMKGNTLYIIEEQEKKKDKYTENTPLLIDQKSTTQKYPLSPFDKKDKNSKELKIINKTGSINDTENEYPDFNIEEETETIPQEGHKKREGNSDSVDNFDFTLISDTDKKGCCCNRPCWPHPDLYRLKVSDLENVIEDIFEKKENLQNKIITPNLAHLEFIEKLKVLDFKQLSQHTITQLNYVTREIEGPWPKWEWVKLKQWGKLKEWAKNEFPGLIVGGGIGVWLSRAMVPVYASAIDYLGFTYIAFDEKPWVNIMRGIGKNLPSYIIPSVIEDAVPRNVILWNKGLTLLKEENLSKKRIVLTALASFFPSLFEPFYLILFEIELIENAILNEDSTSPYKKEMLKYVWPLFMDSWASNFQTTWDLWDDYQEWKESTSCCLFSKTLHTRLPSEEEIIRRDFKKKLDKVNRFLYHTASNKEIKNMYKTVQDSKEEAKKQFGNLDEESLSNAQALLTLNTLLSHGDDLQKIQTYVKSWYDIGADILTDFCLVTGSPARLLTLQLIISSITDLIPMPSGLRHTLNWGLAGFGWIPQTILEWKGLNSFLKQFVAQEEPDSEAIYKNAKILGGCRVGAKAYALWQAFVFTIPLVITVLQVANKWKMDPHWMIGGATFLFAEFATQASQQWERTAQKWVSFFSKAHNVAIRDKCLKKPLRTEYQRSYLIELNQKFKDRLPYLSPQFLQMLKGNMNHKDNLIEEEN